MRRCLNLASRPFRNEAPAGILFWTAAALLAALTVRHALAVQALLPGPTSSALQREAAALEKEIADLRAEARRLRAPAPDPARVSEWLLIKDLVDKRTFSWTQLFSRLEEVLPPGVRLTSVTPQVHRGELRLDVMATARSRADGFELARVLQERAEFADVYPLSVASSDKGEDFTYTMKYRPAAPQGGAP
jgi:Tfp pilus assembly protein PilN